MAACQACTHAAQHLPTPLPSSACTMPAQHAQHCCHHDSSTVVSHLGMRRGVCIAISRLAAASLWPGRLQSLGLLELQLRHLQLSISCHMRRALPPLQRHHARLNESLHPAGGARHTTNHVGTQEAVRGDDLAWLHYVQPTQTHRGSCARCLRESACVCTPRCAA